MYERRSLSSPARAAIHPKRLRSCSNIHISGLYLRASKIAVPLADVITAKKEGRKRVIVKTNKSSYIFGPFPAEVKRSFVLQALMSRVAPNGGEPSAVRVGSNPLWSLRLSMADIYRALSLNTCAEWRSLIGRRIEYARSLECDGVPPSY